MGDYMREEYEREPGGPRSGRRTTRGGRRLAVIGPLLALILIGAALYLAAFGGWNRLFPPKPITFSYRDRILEAKEGVPVNQYDPAGFHVDQRGRVSYEQEGRQACAGIDVSFYQGEIDWAAVAADGVEFAIIRLGYRGYTQGGLNLDSRYEENIQGALDAGLDVGIYFFSQAVSEEEAAAEADFILKNLDGYGAESIKYPVVFDWEPITPGKEARTDGMDGETLTRCAAAFCRRVREAGYTPAVYFNQDMGYLTYDLAQLTEFSFWLAEYDEKPDFYYGFDMWQYTHTGTVEGIQGSVDWNLSFWPVRTEET